MLVLMSENIPAMPDSNNLESTLRAAEQRLEGSYDKRTEHLDENGRAIFINRLILEDSPYLLQHAHNPVNWYPWGAEAFAEARRADKPVFLSIGYSTCHWCHVMEVESFDNVEVAKLLNEHFISIKMDREQFPDIDEIYMTGVQIMSGHGGWPMSSFLLPDGKPFFGATYFPAPSFIDLLGRVRQAWESKRDELETSAESIDRAIKRLLGSRPEEAELADGIHGTVMQALLEREDRSLGGLAGEPKFPQEPLLLYMIFQALQTDDETAMAFVKRALDNMAAGGIYDQVAGGFHRYSVDAQWLVPHFEKMLYNQSQLGLVYLRAWQLTGDNFYHRIVRQTLDYILRDLEIDSGGYYSATDADSEGAEGTFFIWTPAELAAVLSDSEYLQFSSIYDVSERGNFEGANILTLRSSLADSGVLNDEAALKSLDEILHKLYLAREQREHPLRDDKLIVAWNGAMISSLAQAAWVLDNSDWLRSAENAAATIIDRNVDNDACIKRINLHGTCSIDGQLEDYANLIDGLIVLFDVTAKQEYLQTAFDLGDRVLADFYDADKQSLYLSPVHEDAPQLVRSSNAGDGATLSAVATMLASWQALAARSARLDRNESAMAFRQAAQAILVNLAPAINEHALSHTSLLRLVHESTQSPESAFAYVGDGIGKISVRRVFGFDGNAAVCTDNSLTLELRIKLMAGWHIIAEPDQQWQSLAVNLAHDSAWQVQTLQMPKAEARIDAGNDQQLTAFAQDILIKLQLTAPEVGSQRQLLNPALKIKLQLCETGRCLLAEEVCLLP